MYEALFKIAISEQSAWIKAKTPTLRSAAVNRISAASSTLRLAVEVGVAAIKLKTVRAVLDHVRQCTHTSNGETCDPLALDYVKCMRALLEYQPHVEHLPKPAWENAVEFCLDNLTAAQAETDGDDNQIASGSTSYRSSRSRIRDTTASQGVRTITRQLAEESVVCLRLLTSAPNAPVIGKATDLIWTTIYYMKASAASHRSQQDAFACINHVLLWTVTEKVQLTQDATTHILRLIRNFWGSKTSSANDMLITLVQLRPYILQLLDRDSATVLRTELHGLLEIMRSEYTKRLAREQLHMDDVHLALPAKQACLDTRIVCGPLSLRCNGIRAEQTWTIHSTMAFIIRALSQTPDKAVNGRTSDNDSSDGEYGMVQSRPRKRQRKSDDIDELLTATMRGSAQHRTAALQTLVFLCQEFPLPAIRIKDVLQRVSSACSDEDGGVASWALLTAAACASQESSTANALSTQWASLWQVAIRGMTSVSTGRAACHLLHLMVRLRLVSQTALSELLQSFATAIELSGPALICDSALQLLNASLECATAVIPRSANALTENVIGWLVRRWTPSRFEDRMYASATALYGIADVTALLGECLGQSHHVPGSAGFLVWDAVAQGTMRARSQRDVVAYLLSLTEEQKVMHPSLLEQQLQDRRPSTRISVKAASETMILNHVDSELSQAAEVWDHLSRDRPRGISLDVFTAQCKSLAISTCITHCSKFRDTRRQTQMQQKCRTLLQSMESYSAASVCEQDKIDALLITYSQVFWVHQATPNQIGHFSKPTQCGVVLCESIATAMAARRTSQDVHGGNEVDDLMDIDESYDSQDSRKAQKSTSQLVLGDNASMIHGPLTLRAAVPLYALIVSTIATQEEHESMEPASVTVVDHILNLDETSIVATHWVLEDLPNLVADLTTGDVERLLEYLTEDILQAYVYERSEVAIGSILACMASLQPYWTDPGNANLYDLGLDMYRWTTQIALKGGVLSPSVQRQVASLLVQLCHVDTDYGRGDDEVPSVRTSLFRLLQIGAISAQYHLATRISTIFSHFVLQVHESLFEDLEASLNKEIEWLEGIAMRLLFLAELAASWPSLLRQCVYHIFDSAGQIEASVPYATACTRRIAYRLGFESPKELFRLFAPQMVFQWLDEHSLARLPFAIFSFSSMRELLELNCVEIAAQMFMKGHDEGMQFMLRELDTTSQQLLRRSFSKAVAYAIAQDLKQPSAEQANACESRLRNVAGGKEEYNRLLSEHFPAIIGFSYLHMKVEDVDDKWLERRDAYIHVAKALSHIMAIGHSNFSLPPSQEPSFRPRRLIDAVERLCRRITYDPAEIWNPSSFTIAARILLDDLDKALGSLHTCATLRKLRILIAATGEVAVSGYPLEMMLRAVRPFLTDSQCADDALGVLQYLMHRGQTYLRENPSFLCGFATVLLLQMRKHMGSAHDSITQESQHRETIHRMQKFHDWTTEYLRHLYQAVQSSQKHTFDLLVQSLGGIQLPGNARKNSPESQLLLILLGQDGTHDALIQPHDALLAVCMLAEDFQKSPSHKDDALEDDRICSTYAASLWRTINAADLDERFVIWAATKLGQAYSQSGAGEIFSRPSSNWANLKDVVRYDGALRSQALIAKRICRVLTSDDQKEIGLAEYTLRRAESGFIQMGEAEESEVFEHQLPDQMVAIVAGPSTYEPWGVTIRSKHPSDTAALQRALSLNSSTPVETWANEIALVLCNWKTAPPVLAALPGILHHMPDLGQELLPSIVHMMLALETDSDQIIRSLLSSAMTEYITADSEDLLPKQQYLLQLLLYLRQQPYPREATKVDRVRWLEYDALQAANTAARCGLPAFALMLAESATTLVQSNRRASSRASMSQALPVPVPDEILLSIFEQVDEPDSYYGVEQPASLDALLGRLDHEKDGLKSLMFRSAQIDSHMRQSSEVPSAAARGMIRSLTSLNLNSLTYALTSSSFGATPDANDDMLDSARKLQQWDIALPEGQVNSAARLMSVYQHLSQATSQDSLMKNIESIALDHLRSGVTMPGSKLPAQEWLSSLGVISETIETVASHNVTEIENTWQQMQRRQKWMDKAQYGDFELLQQGRQALFSVLGSNGNLLEELHVPSKSVRLLEAKATLSQASLARTHNQVQSALSAATQASDLARKAQATGLRFDAAAQHEVASILWDSGERTTSVKMLRDILQYEDLEQQAVQVGRSGLLAQLGKQLADARLEKPADILDNYLQQAIAHLPASAKGREAGKVYHAFATFCDQQLQHPANLDEYNRLATMRQRKYEEVKGYHALAKSSKKSDEKKAAQSMQAKAEQWYRIDDEEFQKLSASRDAFAQQSLQNYMLALQASDEHDISVLRFFSLWLENDESKKANKIVNEHLCAVPSWKFILLLNQLTSRLQDVRTDFQHALRDLMIRMCLEHPYHCIHHIYASTRKPNSRDEAGQSRYNAAAAVRNHILNTGPVPKREVLQRLLNADSLYRMLAEEQLTDKKPGKRALKNIPNASQVQRKVPDLRLPPVTLNVPVRPDGDYSKVPIVTNFGPTVNIMSGLSTPKVLTAIASNGQQYKQLFKSGNDDLRQDAIMEQVFEEVSKMLQGHEATRKRDLHIRTYKVMPLTKTAGIIEFVANSIPLNDFLQPAHPKYYPKDMRSGQARDEVRQMQTHSQETRVKTFRKICDNLHPVMRHFFLERFDDPDEWFAKRTAYTRTTASVSMLGYVLGLGDRHCHNIMMDEKTGEVVHIDLGVAFEAGRVLPVPELVPFRLTRDIVDGMGVTKTEGVFRRCCEFTMDALREDKDSIMTLLNVLRYDPLYTWTLSPLRAKRMQEGDRLAPGEAEESSRKKGEQGGEADRALAVVERKLTATLSTAAAVNELIQQATDERNLATLFCGWAAWF